MIKIGVLGAGYLGKIHIRLLKEIPQFELVGFYDTNDINSAQVEAEFGIKRFDTIDELYSNIEAVDIVTPTLSHFDYAAKAVRQGKHVFIEKPVTNTVNEAKKLLVLVEESKVKVQVGHVERFNPAYLALNGKDLRPMFIESHRLAQFNPRGTDVSVILDLMVHDIDIILSLVKANVRKISASGVAIISNNPDIANARIEFDNGSVANITASRMSVKQMRKMRLFQKDAYISIDFLEKKTQIYRLFNQLDNNNGNLALEIDTGLGNHKKYLNFEELEVKPVNSIKLELEMFARAILLDIETPVTLLDGYNALRIAHLILEKIEKNSFVT